MAKPSDLPAWDTAETNTEEPDANRQLSGWLAPGGIPEKPNFQYFNWWMNNVYKWINYFEEETETGEWTGGFTALGGGTITIGANNTGTYKLDNGWCTLVGHFDVSAVSGPSGLWVLTGLPFACAPGNRHQAAATVRVSGLSAPLAGSEKGHINDGSSSVSITNSNGQTQADIANLVTTSTEIEINVCYPIA